MIQNDQERKIIEGQLRELGRVDIYVKLSVIVGARSPRPLTNVGWNPKPYGLS